MDTFINILIVVGFLIGAYQFLKSKGLIINSRRGFFYGPMNSNHEDIDTHDKINFQCIDNIYDAGFDFNINNLVTHCGFMSHNDDE